MKWCRISQPSTVGHDWETWAPLTPLGFDHPCGPRAQSEPKTHAQTSQTHVSEPPPPFISIHIELDYDMYVYIYVLHTIIIIVVWVVVPEKKQHVCHWGYFMLGASSPFSGWK